MNNYLESHNKELEFLAIGAAASIVIPKALRLTHYTGAILQNIYIDLKYLGLTGTIKQRSDLTPRKQTIQSVVDCFWDGLRMIPIGVLQRVMDAEVEKNVAIMARTGYDEPQSLKRQGIPLEENKTLNDALR